jgi:hypothetical protein
MAFGSIDLSIDASELDALRKALGSIFDNEGLSATLEAALEKAIHPAYLRLREVTPVGPSGNLQRAVAMKTKAYPKNGGAVGMVGYNRSGKAPAEDMAGAGSTKLGKDRAFHQWWLEFGTKSRVVSKLSNTPYRRRTHVRRMKSGVVATIRDHQVSGQNAVIASSFKKRGQVFAPDGSMTPFSFFKKGKKGQTSITIDPSPAGGVRGRPPVQTAWNQLKGRAAEILVRELNLSLEQALSRITLSSTGTVSGSDVIQAGG